MAKCHGAGDGCSVYAKQEAENMVKLPVLHYWKKYIASQNISFNKKKEKVKTCKTSVYTGIICAKKVKD